MLNHLLRRGSILALFGMLAAALVLPGSASAGDEEPTPVADLLPDLTTRRPSDLRLDTFVQPGKTMLRFTNEILNRGQGPMELTPKVEDCDDDGDNQNDRRAYQHIFLDTNSSTIFERATDQHRETPAGCSIFHEVHEHWHFEEFADYELYRLHAEKGPVRKRGTDKVSFCLTDSDAPKPNLPGAPDFRYYGWAENCDADSVTGISIGWSDIYSSGLADQWVDVTSLRGGEFCLLSTVDPNNRIAEMSDENNSRGVRLTLFKGKLTYLFGEHANRRGCQVDVP